MELVNDGGCLRAGGDLRLGFVDDMTRRLVSRVRVSLLIAVTVVTVVRVVLHVGRPSELPVAVVVPMGGVVRRAVGRVMGVGPFGPSVVPRGCAVTRAGADHQHRVGARCGLEARRRSHPEVGESHQQ